MLYLVRFGELSLKGKNRKYFEKTLLGNIKEALRSHSVEIIPQHDRILVRVEKDEEHVEVRERLQKVFGIISLSPVDTAPLSMEAIQKQALELITRNCHKPFTFKVETRRANKSFPQTSPKVNQQVGAFILNNTDKATVDVHSPEVELKIEIRQKETYLLLTSYSGAGGLPVGVSGKGLLMLSGGIDSPVAGWLCMKRGMDIEAIHFHSYPFTSERAREKVKELTRIISQYSGKINLHVMPFTEIQKKIQSHCPQELAISVMRRMMFLLSSRLAKQLNAGALITGESLGQVASQTLENISVVSEEVNIPVFRPLIGLDKQEIINLSSRIGTYPVSILPYEDCCTVFLPKHPATRPTREQVQEAEKRLEVNSLIKNCLEQRETFKLKFHESKSYVNI